MYIIEKSLLYVECFLCKNAFRLPMQRCNTDFQNVEKIDNVNFQNVDFLVPGSDSPLTGWVLSGGVR
jgi:hypothetical protein